MAEMSRRIAPRAHGHNQSRAHGHPQKLESRYRASPMAHYRQWPTINGSYLVWRHLISDSALAQWLTSFGQQVRHL
eukprot:CAMPEP_0119539150 /NCGR_PEP_ID=MMETSP1344-20130328/51393_1 /TAXON_ID=236787 /ORGANISM="Florenciella parvula, Strain CCMP2471" /LENGTH=75 /DNA_ID=CAMNT_0007582351 /DNA_START=199 /DNA_END=423 /DNA_ORIENTATION=-